MERKLIFEKSSKGKRGYYPPQNYVPQVKIEDLIPEELLRKSPPELPEVSEPEVVRHYTNLSRMNMGVDTSFYPLGSCTMKYNPKFSEDIASFDEFTMIHPLEPEEWIQGCLEVIYRAERYLAEITGMSRFSMVPSAGAHGELTGMLIVKKYFEERGEVRRKIIIPDTAHGTNPASASLAGFSVVNMDTEGKGIITAEILKKYLDSDVACLMVTNPNTLGLFEKEILKISQMLKEAGALLYCDGANLNALVGRVKVGKMGVDILHINLHKTFSTPHGGGGPGSGPVGVREDLKEFLPAPVVERGKDGFYLRTPQKSIGMVKAFGGNFLIILKALSYILSLGDEGLKMVSGLSVLNANYLRVKLREFLHLPYDELCMHECVFSEKTLKERGITTMDLAKRLIDYGFHPPTVYFPLIVKGAIMVEPTETESPATLDAFADAVRRIIKEAEENPEYVRNAPHRAPLKKLDEVRAARNLVLRWKRNSQ